MEPFKEVFNVNSISLMADHLLFVDDKFNRKAFLDYCLHDISSKELKERVITISEAISLYLPGDFERQVTTLVATLKSEEDHIDNNWTGKDASETVGISGFLVWPYTHFIEQNGTSYFDLSLGALKEMTSRFTSEFAIRVFLQNYYEETMTLLLSWINDENHHVRRLVSEGTRPSLPWARKVLTLGQNVDFHLQFLEKLLNDPSEYVRKSVSNHLNDLSKIDSDKVISFCKQHWVPTSTERKKLIRHALRTLLKKGHVSALAIIGHKQNIDLTVSKASLDKSTLVLGEDLNLKFSIELNENSSETALIDYVLYLPRKNGEYSQKVFRLKELLLRPNELTFVTKKISIKPITTRTYYEGTHYIELVVNGRSFDKMTFDLRFKK